MAIEIATSRQSFNLEMILSGSLGKINNIKQKQSLDYIFTGIMTLIDNLEDMIAVSSFETEDQIKIKIGFNQPLTLHW